jgi:hypothetical protein
MVLKGSSGWLADGPAGPRATAVDVALTMQKRARARAAEPTHKTALRFRVGLSKSRFTPQCSLS